MPQRAALASLAVLALALSVVAWWNTSGSGDALSSSESGAAATAEKGALSPPAERRAAADREVLGGQDVASELPELDAAAEPEQPLEPLIVTARLPYPVPGLADDRFTLYAIDPDAPLAPRAGTPMRLDRSAEVQLPADCDLVQLQVTGNGLILDPQPFVRNPSGAELELLLDATGSVRVRVLEPWLGKPDVMVYVAGSDHRDIWTEVMEGRGQTPDLRGECRFADLLPGNYLVQSENSETREAGALKRIVRVAAGRESTIEIGGPEPSPLVLAGTVQRAGEPVVGIDVNVGSFELSSGAKTQTDAQGRFEVSLRGAGRYEFRIDTHREHRDVDALGTPQRFELPSESLCVRFRHADRALAVPAAVSLSTLIESGVDPRRHESRVELALEDGSACFAGLEAGRYLLAIADAGLVFDEERRIAPQQFEISVPTAGAVQLVLASSSSLDGRVRVPSSTDDGRFLVYLRSTSLPGAAWQRHATTNDAGRFSVDPLACGEYELVAVSRSGSHTFASQLEYVQAPRVASDPLVIEAWPATRLIVEARDVDGSPLRIRLALWSIDGRPWPADGMHYNAANRQTSLPVPPGTYDVYGLTPEGKTLHARVDVSGSLVTQRVVLLR